MKKIKSLFLLFLALVTSAVLLASCGLTGGETPTPDGGAADGENGGGSTSDKYIFTEGTKVYIVIGEGVKQDFALSIGNDVTRLTGVNVEYMTPEENVPEGSHQILLGVCGDRELSRLAYRKLDRVRDEFSDLIGYLIYTDGSSVGIAFDPSEDDLAQTAAVDYFVENFLKETTLTMTRGTVHYDVIDTYDYYAAIDAHNFAKKWEAMAEEIGGELGERVVLELKALYDIYYSRGDLVSWFANLLDVDICCCEDKENCDPTTHGVGYYYSNSARNNEGYLPDAESTNQALGFWSSSGMAYLVGGVYYKAIPEWMKIGIGNFIYSLQDEDGFFYHPQWPKDYIIANGRVSRRARDLNWCVSMLNSVGRKPRYDTPTGVSGEENLEPVAYTHLPARLGTDRVTAVSKVVAVASTSMDTDLENEQTFRAYLSRMDIKNKSYPVGNELTSISPQIIQRDKELKAEGAKYSLMEILIEWLNENQNPETGHWDWLTPSDSGYSPYYGVNGLLKISGIYNSAKVPMPNPLAACNSCINAINVDQPLGAVVDIYNPWFAIGNVLDNLRKYGGPQGNVDADFVVSEMRAQAPEAIARSATKIAVHQKDDGSFSYAPKYSSSTSQGVPAAVPESIEGDVNGTVISTTGLVGNILKALELSSYKVPMYGEADRRRYISIIEDLGVILKDTASYEPVFATFDDDPEGDEPSEVDISKLSPTGSAVIAKEYPGAKNQVLRFTSKAGGGDYVNIPDSSNASGATTFVFEGNFCIESASIEYPLQMFIGDCAMLTMNMTDRYTDESGATAYKTVKLFNRSASSDVSSVNIELDSSIAVGKWFSLKVVYYYGDHDSVRIKIYLDTDLSDGVDRKLIAVTDNYYDYYGNKIANGTGSPSKSFAAVRLYAMKDANLVLLMDDVAAYRTAEHYEAVTDPDAQPPYNVDAPDREPLTYNFEDGVLPEDISVSANAGLVAVEERVLAYYYTGGKDRQAPKVTFPVNVLTRTADCVSFSADFVWTGAKKDANVMNIVFRSPFSSGAGVIGFMLRRVGNSLVLCEAANGKQGKVLDTVSIPMDRITNLRIDYYSAQKTALIYIDDDFRLASSPLYSTGAKEEAGLVELSGITPGNLFFKLDNVVCEKNTSSFDEAVKPEKDTVTETFGSADSYAGLIGGGAKVEKGLLELTKGAYLELPLNIRSKVTSTAVFEADVVLRDGAPEGEVGRITFSTPDGKGYWSFLIASSGSGFGLYEYTEGGTVSDVPLASFPIGVVNRIRLELFADKKLAVVYDAEGKPVTLSSAYYSESTLAEAPATLKLEGLSGTLHVDNLVAEALYKYYQQPELLAKHNPETGSPLYTFEGATTDNLPGDIAYKLASGGAAVRAEHLYLAHKGVWSSVLAFDTATGGNDSITFVPKGSGTGATVFEADIRFGNNVATTTYQLYFGNSDADTYSYRAYMLSVVQTSSGTLKFTDDSWNGADVSDGGKRWSNVILDGKTSSEIVLRPNEWFNLRIEYYKGTANSVRIVILINGEIAAVSDNYFGWSTATPSRAPVNNVSKVYLYSLNSSNGTVWFDNVRCENVSDTFEEKYDPDLITDSKYLVGGKQ